MANDENGVRLATRDYVDGNFKVVCTKLTAMEKALDLAKREVDRRLEDMNKLRDQINNERVNYIARDYFEAQHSSLEKLVSETRDSINKRQGEMMGANKTATIVISIIASISAIIAFISGILVFFHLR